MRAAGFFSLATSKCPPGSSTIPSPRDPFGRTACAISPAPPPQDRSRRRARRLWGGWFDTRRCFLTSETRRRPSKQTAAIWGHAGEASNLRASQCRCTPVNSALIATRQGEPGDLRRPVADRNQDIRRVGRDANKCRRPREVARRSYGTLAAGCCSTYRFSPWERVSAGHQGETGAILIRGGDLASSFSKEGWYPFA